jgi:hypothetical protein
MFNVCPQCGQYSEEKTIGWLVAHAATTSPPMELLDTSTHTLAESAAQVAGWVRSHLSGPNGR